jgi:hypothetical protein
VVLALKLAIRAYGAAVPLVNLNLKPATIKMTIAMDKWTTGLLAPVKRPAAKAQKSVLVVDG